MARALWIAVIGLAPIPIILSARYIYITWGEFPLSMVPEAWAIAFTLRPSILVTGSFLAAIVVSPFIQLWRKGWQAMREHLLRHLLETLIPAMVVVAAAFIYILFVDVPAGIYREAEKTVISWTPMPTTLPPAMAYERSQGVKFSFNGA